MIKTERYEKVWGSVNVNCDGVGLGVWWARNDCRYRAVNFPEKNKANKKVNKNGKKNRK